MEATILYFVVILVLSLPVPIPDEEKKINVNFYFHTSKALNAFIKPLRHYKEL